MTDIGLCEEGRDAAFGQEAGLNPATRPTGKQSLPLQICKEPG